MSPSAFPLKRDVAALRHHKFDLLVIGGGIYGAWTAYDAALRGLSVALIEQNDWAGGTSSASSKLIHGGLRYLEHFEFGLVRHALAERKVLSRIAPHAVQPLRFAVPMWKDSAFGPFKLRLGLTFYDWLAGSGQPVGPHNAYSRERSLLAWPFLEENGLRAVASYGDCQEDDARLTMTVVAAAQAAGAVVANRLQADALSEDARGVHGARVTDRVTGEQFDLGAASVVAAAGPWIGRLLGESTPSVELVMGAHLLLPPLPDEETSAFLLTAPQDGRAFFVIPWYGHTLVGTTETRINDISEAHLRQEDVDYLLSAVARRMPGLGWSTADVHGAFVGVRTLQAESTTSLSAVSREFAIESPRSRLLVPLGGKYTTSRVDAAQIVDSVQQILGRARSEPMSGTQLLPGSPEQPFAQWLEDAVNRLQRAGVDATAAHSVALRFGTRIDGVLALIADDATCAQRVEAEAPFIWAEVRIAVRDEMALSLADIFRRRMPLTLITSIGRDAISRASAMLAERWHWDATRTQQEINAFHGESAVNRVPATMKIPAAANA